MAEGTVQANAITLWYETLGDAADPALVLIMGLGAQALFWSVEFCERLAAGGRYVIRFDNRETGLSTWFDEQATYTLEDMADDTVGLLDALDITAAHVLGTSMGGMIAQWVAVRHPARVLSLTSMSSGPYVATDPATASLTKPTFDLAASLSAPVPETREGRVAQRLALVRQLWGTHPFDGDLLTDLETAMDERAYRPEAGLRQGAAMQRSPSRAEALQRLTVPTLVIHGTADPLIPPDRGQATAALIPGAQLLLVDGMGHSFPRSCWDEIIGAILQHTTAATSATA
jgi:pimeloyl-ACP methyl ester carboxylesterase